MAVKPDHPRGPAGEDPEIHEVESLASALARAAQSGPTRKRVQSVDIGGQRYWLKRREQLSGRMRIQKGSPARAFQRERAALRLLAGRPLPVPELAADSGDFLATIDAGPSLLQLSRDPSCTAQERMAAFAAAGNALAAFHNAGLAHGRPHIKDFCWLDGKLTIIDFERFHPRRNGLRRMRNDLLMLVFSALVEFRQQTPDVDALCAAYRTNAPGKIWPAAQRLCRNLWWIDPVTRPLQRRVGRSAEFKAIPLVLERFADG